MTSLYKRKRLTVITIVYWFLLSYIVTALIFWFLSLMKQNDQMAEYRLLELKKDDPDYLTKVAGIEAEQKGRVFQYIGEGSTFMLLILVGAVFVYRATRKQIRLNDQQQNFMMAITHELKTPIAIVKLNLETIHKRKLDEEQEKKLVVKALGETNRLNDLCTNILLASQIDAGSYSLQKEALNLNELVYESAHYFKSGFARLQLEALPEEAVYIKGDPLLLQLAVNNLIDNAIKYSGKEKMVSVQLSREKTDAIIKVKDQGEGITNREKARIFEKFYRKGSESTRNTRGTGLGLYLTKKIIKDHGGSIWVEDNAPSGCIFVVKLRTMTA